MSPMAATQPPNARTAMPRHSKEGPAFIAGPAESAPEMRARTNPANSPTGNTSTSQRPRAALARPHDLVAEAREAGCGDDRHQRPAGINPPMTPRRPRVDPNRTREPIARSHRAAVRIGLHGRHSWLDSWLAVDGRMARSFHVCMRVALQAYDSASRHVVKL